MLMKLGKNVSVFYRESKILHAFVIPSDFKTESYSTPYEMTNHITQECQVGVKVNILQSFRLCLSAKL